MLNNIYLQDYNLNLYLHVKIDFLKVTYRSNGTGVIIVNIILCNITNNLLTYLHVYLKRIVDIPRLGDVSSTVWSPL